MTSTRRRIGMGATVLVLAVGLGACGGGDDGGSGASEPERKAAGEALTACLANRTPAQVTLTAGTDAGNGCASGPNVTWSYEANGRPFTVEAFVQSGAPIARLQQASGAYDFCQNFHKVANGPALTVGVRFSPYQITSRRLDGNRLEIAFEPGTQAAC